MSVYFSPSLERYTNCSDLGAGLLYQVVMDRATGRQVPYIKWVSLRDYKGLCRSFPLSSLHLAKLLLENIVALLFSCAFPTINTPTHNCKHPV